MEKFKFLMVADAFISELRKDAPEMPVQMLQVFLEAARTDGLRPSDVQLRLGQTRSSASRNLSALATGISAARDGYRWLETRHDPTDARVVLYYLSPKGKEVLARLAAAVPN